MKLLLVGCAAAAAAVGLSQHNVAAFVDHTGDGYTVLSASTGALKVNVSNDGKTFSVMVEDETWFYSGDATVTIDGQQWSVLNGTLALMSTNSTRGSDAAGQYDALSFDWGVGGISTWTTTYKAYDQSPPTIVFQQTYNVAILDAEGGSRFPDLALSKRAPIGALEYTGESCGFMVESHPSVSSIRGGNGNGAIVLSPQDVTGRGANASLAVGPVTEFFVNTAYSGGVSYGVAPTFTSIPYGFVVETALVAAIASNASTDGIRASIPGGGTNAALAAYGDFVLARHGKTRAAGDINNITKYLGYSTTGSAFVRGVLQLGVQSDESANKHSRS